MSKLLLIFIAALALPSLAIAQTEAELRYQEAVRLFGEGRYRESLGAFDQAIELEPQSVFYCNRALVLLKLQETSLALVSMQKCRELFVGDTAELASIDAQVKGLEVYEFHLKPKTMTIARDIAAGPLDRGISDSTSWDVGDTGFVLLGISAALIASAATLDLLSADLKEDFVHESEGGPGTSIARYNDLKERLKTRQTIFYGLGLTGIGLGIAGGALLVYHYSSQPETIALPYIGPDGFGIIGKF